MVLRRDRTFFLGFSCECPVVSLLSNAESVEVEDSLAKKLCVRKYNEKHKNYDITRNLIMGTKW